MIICHCVQFQISELFNAAIYIKNCTICPHLHDRTYVSGLDDFLDYLLSSGAESDQQKVTLNHEEIYLIF